MLLCFFSKICEIEVSNRPPRSNWSTLGIQPSLGIPIWLFLHIPFLVLILSYSAIWYDRNKGLWCCGNRDSAIEGSPAFPGPLQNAERCIEASNFFEKTQILELPGCRKEEFTKGPVETTTALRKAWLSSLVLFFP